MGDEVKELQERLAKVRSETNEVDKRLHEMRAPGRQRDAGEDAAPPRYAGRWSACDAQCTMMRHGLLWAHLLFFRCL
jgi:hypothetical protein